jgi:hypothetical protein
MAKFFRRLLFLLVALLLLIAPAAIRSQMLHYDERHYTPPNDPGISFAATPAPTTTPRALPELPNQTVAELRPGPLVVDLAHFNSLNPSGLQPLADAVARRGIGLRLWLSKVDPSTVKNFLEFPDQSAELATQLADASGLVVVSPFFLWSKEEIALVQRFVADGGRLLLISDPDVFGDAAIKTNLLGEPFGVVFNDDYLYDTVENDKNFTFFFQGNFYDQAAALAGAKVAFYGGRSIGGAVTKEVTSAPSTLSSLRTGASGFTTVAIGGLAANDSAGRVLALSDFDVLTEPNVLRYDNHLLLEFVAGFLAADQRTNTVADFPAYLGKEVALTFGSSQTLDADLLLLGAQLQQRLQQTDRTLSLTNVAILSDTVPVSVTATLSSTTDLLYLADFKTAAQATTLLRDSQIKLTQEVVTATTTPTAVASPVAPTPEPMQPVAHTAALSTTIPVTTSKSTTATKSISATAVMTATPLPATTPAPTIQLVLTTRDGLRLVAEQTVLILRRKQMVANAERDVLAVIGADQKGISAGVARLIHNDLADCITGQETTFCPLAAAAASEAKTGQATEKSVSKSGEARPKPKDNGSGGAFAILLVDDNKETDGKEASEADTFLKILTDAKYTPDLWVTKDTGLPTAEDLKRYQWVIWSNAAYSKSEITPEEINVISEYLIGGGHLTISSRSPIFGATDTKASAVRDLVVVHDEPELAQGLPETPITLTADLPLATPLDGAENQEQTQVVLRRGEASDNANAPALFAFTDNQTSARMQVSAISFTWLPPEVAQTLVLNMAQWMGAPK